MTTKTKPKTIAYLRVSTINQDLEKDKNGVLKLANELDLGKVTFVEEIVSGKKPWKDRKIKDVIDSLQESDNLIVPELSRLGRSTIEVLDILKEAKIKGAFIHTVNGRFELNGDSIATKVLVTMLALFAELERDFLSLRTREGLAALKAKGIKLGRPPGPGKSKLDKHKDEIVALLRSGMMKKFVAKKYNTTADNMRNWIRKNKLDVKPRY